MIILNCGMLITLIALLLIESLDGFLLTPSVTPTPFTSVRRTDPYQLIRLHRPDIQPSSFSSEEGDLNRRKLLQSIVAAAIAYSPTFVVRAADTNSSIATVETTPDRITVPLEFIPSLNAYILQYNLFGERFGAIIDTGSPFLTVPATCSQWSYKYKWGCYHPEKTLDSGLGNTIEYFDNNQGTVVWRKAEFAFDEAITTKSQLLTFGVLGTTLLDGPGGVFFGLIKNTDNWIRPSFLGQTGYNSFSVDLRQTPQLTLSKKNMIQDDDYIPLVRDLNRRFKAPVVYYTAKASKFVVNGLSLKLDDNAPTYVIFDTGLSGMAVSEELFEGRNLQARKNKEKSLWGEVCVAFRTNAGREVELTAMKPITTPIGRDTPWTRFKGNLIVLGLAFLNDKCMVVDIEDDKLQFVN